MGKEVLPGLFGLCQSWLLGQASSRHAGGGGAGIQSRGPPKTVGPGRKGSTDAFAAWDPVF